MAGFADVVIGTQYGDEGKARVIDDLAGNYNIVARFNGGANAGHTVEAEGIKLALKQIPSAVFYPQTTLYIGSGCMVNLRKITEEIQTLKSVGININGRLKISSQAGVIQPHHLLIDALTGKEIGTTKNGIGPAYGDRALRMWGDRLLNIRMGDLFANPEKYFALIKNNYEETKKIYNLQNFDIDKEIEELKLLAENLYQFVEQDTLFITKKIEEGQNILFEGAQSYMLDVNKGSVPFVTSSSTMAQAAYTGGDLPVQYHRKTIGVAKAIMSRVGHGPFTSEFGGSTSEEYCMSLNPDGSSVYSQPVEANYDIDNLLASEDPFEIGKALRVLSREYGTVTARPRRVGIFDLIQLSHAIKLNGIKELIITKCDLLSAYSKTKVGKMPLVTGYELDGKKIDYVPGATDVYYKVKPVIEYRDAFSEDISAATKYEDLPAQLKSFIEEIEQKCGCKVAGIGVGPKRDQYISLG